MSFAAKIVLGVLLAGWLADLLASRDRDVEAGIEAYDAGDLVSALTHFDAAIERHGDRAELSFNRGLVLLAQADVESARRAFEHASEAEDYQIRASAMYELGNLTLDAEDFEAAIAAYIECLKARPDHENAKWNLELALQGRAAQEKKDEEEKQQDEQDEEQEQDESGGEQDESGGEQEQEQEQGESGGEREPEPEQGESGGEQEQEQEQGESGGEPEPEPEPEPEQEPEADAADKDAQGQPDAQPTPAPLSQMDIEKALEELDAQDVFLLDRPPGRTQTPVQDW